MQLHQCSHQSGRKNEHYLSLCLPNSPIFQLNELYPMRIWEAADSLSVEVLPGAVRVLGLSMSFALVVAWQFPQILSTLHVRIL